jgi:hypothetical protein
MVNASGAIIRNDAPLGIACSSDFDRLPSFAGG